MIKVSELFGPTHQGEGYWLGQPSIFLRTFGCNFSCGGFGMPAGQKSIERDQIDPSKYEKFEDLPLVRTGCDSYPSWDPKFKHLSPMLSEEQIAQDIRALLPNGSFLIDDVRNVHLVITGGEPLLSWQRSYPALLDLLPELTNLTFETNGTQPLSKALIEYFNRRNETRAAWEANWENSNISIEELMAAPEPPRSITVTFSVSPKLSASGELWSQAIRPEVMRSFEQVNDRIMYLKFVVAGEEHIPEVEQAVKELGVEQVFLMPVGGCFEEYMHYQEIVYDMCLKYGYRMSPRYHVNVKGNAWGV